MSFPPFGDQRSFPWERPHHGGPDTEGNERIIAWSANTNILKSSSSLGPHNVWRQTARRTPCTGCQTHRKMIKCEFSSNSSAGSHSVISIHLRCLLWLRVHLKRRRELEHFHLINLTISFSSARRQIVQSCNIWGICVDFLLRLYSYLWHSSFCGSTETVMCSAHSCNFSLRRNTVIVR